MSALESSPDPRHFRERLLPGPMWWLVVAAIVAMIAIAYGAALGTAFGIIVGAGLVVMAVIALVRSSPIVAVSAMSLQCGRAQLPRRDIVDVRIVDRTDITQIRRGHDPLVGDRAYVVIPAWFSRSAVLVQLEDGMDPHSAWIIATRQPRNLAAALATPVAQ